MNCVIENTSIAADDWDLLEAVGQELDWSAAIAHPLTRYGFSGARIYLLEPRQGHGGIPQIVKISTARDIDEEIAGMKIARSHVRRFSAFSEYSHPIADIKAISIPMFATRPKGYNTSPQVMDAADVYDQALTDGLRSSEALERMLKDALDLLDRAHVVLSDPPSVTYLNCCERYLRQRHRSRVQDICEVGDFEIQGYRVASNPTLILADLLEQPSVGFTCACIHGDLHLSNIVADGNITNPTLIDYAWTKRSSHVLIDFVMLESSLRIMRFPRSVNPGLMLKIDRALTNDFSGDEAHRIISALSGSSITRQRLEVMFGAVRTVRRKAEELAKENMISEHRLEAEYFKLMYIILCGQEKFDDNPLVRTIINLDLLRHRIVLCISLRYITHQLSTG